MTAADNILYFMTGSPNGGYDVWKCVGSIAEKFLVSPEGEIVSRFRPMTEPESDDVVSAIEAALPA